MSPRILPELVSNDFPLLGCCELSCHSKWSASQAVDFSVTRVITADGVLPMSI